MFFKKRSGKEDKTESVEFSDLDESGLRNESAGIFADVELPFASPAADSCEDGGRSFTVVNMTPFEWVLPIVSQKASREASAKIVRFFAPFLLLCLLAAGAYSFMLFVLFEKERYVKRSTSDVAAVVAEYEVVADNVAAYKEFAAIPNSPTLNAQFEGVAYLASRNGFLVSGMSFSRELTGEAEQRINKDNFAVETGRSLDSINLDGVWTITGTLSPRSANASGDTNWGMGFAKQAEVLFGRIGRRAYARAVSAESMIRSNQSSEMMITVLLWR